jgi:cupin fold WbuC family metalloprotein
MIPINQELLNQLIEQARTNPRKRTNFNFHRSSSETMHRMLNAMEPHTYVRPHKHQDPDKNEAFIVLKGKVAVITFEESGKIKDCLVLEAGQGKFGVEISPGTIHTLVCLDTGTVLYEVKDGPYDEKTDKKFAHFAPDESNQLAGLTYLRELYQKLSLEITF